MIRAHMNLTTWPKKRPLFLHVMRDTMVKELLQVLGAIVTDLHGKEEVLENIVTASNAIVLDIMGNTTVRRLLQKSAASATNLDGKEEVLEKNVRDTQAKSNHGKCRVLIKIPKPIEIDEH